MWLMKLKQATEEPTGLDTVPPIPPGPESIQESRLRIPDSSNDHP